MLVTIPICKPDPSCSIPVLIDAMERAFQKFSPGSNHNLLIVSSPDAKQYADLLLSKIQQYFSNVAVEALVTNHSLGWPRENNFYFQQTCYLVPKYAKPNQGWLWMELDCVPLTANWLTILEQEYYLDSTTAQKEGRLPRRFMGAREETVKSVAGERVHDGSHMAASGIYSSEMSGNPVLTTLPSMDQHFSVRLKWYTTISKGSQALNETIRIQNNNQTKNYREEGGKVVCDSAANNAWDVHWNSELSHETVLLRGCLDGSLIDLVSADRKVNVQIIESPKMEISQPAEPKKSKMFVQMPAPSPRPFPNIQSITPTQSLLNRGQAPAVQPESLGINPLRAGSLPPTTKKYGEHRQLNRDVGAGESPQITPLPIPVQSEPETDEELIFHNPPTAPPENNVPFDEEVSIPPAQPPMKPIPRSYRKKGRKLNLSPEERQRRSDAAKARFAKKVETSPC